MRLNIDEVYTLETKTEAEILSKVTGDPLFTGLPVVTYRYRPALPDALADWRYVRGRATSGKAEVEANATLIVDHLVSWDVEDVKGQPIPITAANVRRLPEPILDQIVSKVIVWAPKAEAVAGNSPGV